MRTSTATDGGKGIPHKLAILILGPLCGLLATCKKPDLPLGHLRIGGCSLLWDQASHLVCVADGKDNLPIILSLEGPPLTGLRLAIGGTVQGETTFSSTRQATVSVPLPKVASQVTIGADSAKGRAEYILHIQTTMPFAKAPARLSTLACDRSASQCQESAQNLLAELDASPSELAAPEQAFLMGELGKRLARATKKAAHAADAPALRQLTLSVLERAMAEARATGLLSVEAWALVRLGRVLFDQDDTYDAHLTIAKLSDPVHERALAYCPEQLSNIRYQQSDIAESQGDLVASRRYAREAADLAEEFALERFFQLDTRLQEALAAQYLQESQEAERIVTRVEKQLRDGFLSKPCELAMQHNTLAWIKLVARQTGHSAADPEASFQQAAASLQQCEERSRHDEYGAILATNRALYAMLRAEEAAAGSGERLRQLDRAEAMGRQAGGDQDKARLVTQSDIETDLADLAARIALLRGQGQQALHAFAQLEKRTTAERLSPYYHWASQIGQADAYLLQGKTAEARTYYERAEALLDRMTAELPMTSRRQLFLTQFEAGTGRYLKLLLSIQGAEGKVLEVIRHARVRALRTYAGGPRTARGQSKTAELLTRYSTLLAEREATQAELQGAPRDEEAVLQNRLQRLKSDLEMLLEMLYTSDRADGGHLQPPAAHELLLACYPLPAEPGEPPPQWVCAGGTASSTQVLRIAAPTDAAPELAAQAILAGFGEALRQKKHLRVLPYGPLREVPWASLPWAGGRLGEQLTISYGVDPLAMDGHIPQAGYRALLVTNPQQDLIGAQRTGERLRKELQLAGWQLHARAGAPRHGGHWLTLLRESLRGHPSRPALAKEVVSSLLSADLFIYYGHAESVGPGGWDSHLLFAEDGRISARDIMSLPVVPRRVLLIGCETAVSDREAPADEAGLAQAFVLRGSKEVLATTRKVGDATAEALVAKLAQFGALRPDGPPLSAALRDASAALRPLVPAADLDAFRIYTP